ncbi:MAG: two-component system response regulator BaeR [Pseudohongiella sp.]|nr:two-component system response regulator BaeR [Pseudohongiella sp.]MAO39803.1 two-component system response regulator BaeR [Pseudohongiella sp.]
MASTAESPLILIVEDEPRLSSLMKDYLEASGYRTRIVDQGNEVLTVVRQQPPALIVLDLMLPGRDGLDVCRELRTFSDVPVIMVTARVEEIDRLLGLELGADDYLCKPFSPRELVSRVKAILRRVGRQEPANSSKEGLIIDEEAYTVSLNGKSLAVTPVEMRLLKTMVAVPGRVFSRDQLLDHAYVDHRVVTDRAVDSHIRNLRRKLEQAYPDKDLIHSVYGVGYKYEP